MYLTVLSRTFVASHNWYFAGSCELLSTELSGHKKGGGFLGNLSPREHVPRGYLVIL